MHRYREEGVDDVVIYLMNGLRGFCKYFAHLQEEAH